MWLEVSLTKVVTHLATRCLCPGGHLTKGHPVQSSTKLGHEMSLPGGVHLTTGVCDQSSHTFGHKMSLPGKAQVDSLFHRQSANLPAATGQQTGHVTKYQPVSLWIGQIVGGRRTGGLTILGPYPGSQHSHWLPFGEWPTWPRPGKWHKWALQPIIYHWHYFQGPFAVLYLSLNQIFLHKMYRNMIWTIFSPDQFTHILPPSIWCINTPRYYFWGTTFIITNFHVSCQNGSH